MLISYAGRRPPGGADGRWSVLMEIKNSRRASHSLAQRVRLQLRGRNNGNAVQTFPFHKIAFRFSLIRLPNRLSVAEN